jgi:starch synthase
VSAEILRIGHVAAEYAGQAQTGGLADAVAALAKHQARRGHDVRVVMPLYGSTDETDLAVRPEPAIQEVVVPLGGREYTFSACSLGGREDTARVYLVDCPAAYGGREIYTEDPDEHLRFALLARAALEICQRLAWSPSVLHCHDWHAALVPLYRKTLYAWDDVLETSPTVLTVHNLAYQGAFAREAAAELDLGPEVDAGGQHGEDFRFLEAGLRHADKLTTVSPTYAREILTPERGEGLDAVLRERTVDLVGILNGIDEELWNPETDPALPATYSRNDLAGKRVCRQKLLADLGLAPDPAGPVIGIVSRLAWQKGFDLLPPIADGVLAASDLRLVVLGTGDPELETYFADLAFRFASRVAFRPIFDADLARLIEAGSDLFLMPSRYEPCGLNQMYSMRYGTPPIVHRTGGLADTVEPFDEASGRGTGFLFEPCTPEALRQALERALDLFRRPEPWRRLVVNGMARDFSWARQVDQYLGLYRELVAARS